MESWNQYTAGGREAAQRVEEEQVRSERTTAETLSVEAVLKRSLREVRGMWAHHPRTIDAVPRYNRGNVWAVVTLLYSGVEQALKVLAACDQGLTREEALRRDPNDRWRRNWFQKLGHPLHPIWAKLSKSSRETLEDHWQQFRSLHGLKHEEGRKTAATFLKGISTEGGYARWRYALIENEDVPRVSIEGMIQLWESANELYGIRQNCSRPRKARGPADRIETAAYNVWAIELCNLRNREPSLPEGTMTEIERWAAGEDGCRANRTAELLWRHARGLPQVTEGLSEGAQGKIEELAREVYRSWALWDRERGWEATDLDEYVLEMHSKPNLERWRMASIEGGTRMVMEGPGQRLRIEVGIRRELAQHRRELPPNTLKRTGQVYRRAETLQHLLAWMYERGFETTEHHCPVAAGAGGAPGYYMLAQGCKPTDQGGAKVSIWLRTEGHLMRIHEMGVEIEEEPSGTDRDVHELREMLDWKRRGRLLTRQARWGRSGRDR